MLWLHLSDTRLMRYTLDTGLKHTVTSIQCSKALYHLLSGDTPKGWAAVDRLEEQAYRNHIEKQTNTNPPTNQPHHEILPLGRNSSRYQDRLQATSWKSALQERPWGS